MNKQLLICTLAILIIFAACQPTTKKIGTSTIGEKSTSCKHWVWINPNGNDSDEVMATRYKKFKEAGIAGIFFEADNERHFRAAKAAGLEAHRWIWTMNRGDVLQAHPELAAISRTGLSCATNPPYVGYYKWMCPSQPEVLSILENEVKAELAKDYIDGIHLDYVRYCDVVLAVNLWQVYGIKQTEELPEYDFCYCDLCKKQFKEKYHQDLDSIEYPQESLSWRTFRYDAVTNIVNRLSEIAKTAQKPITAAVFPTPDVAKRIIRQDWTNWNLTAVCPMIYHGFYRENVPWIGDAVKQGLRGLNNRIPLYAGIYLPDFKNNTEIDEGIKYAINNGASGISLFGNVNDEILEILKKYKTVVVNE